MITRLDEAWFSNEIYFQSQNLWAAPMILFKLNFCSNVKSDSELKQDVFVYIYYNLISNDSF